MKKNIFLFSLLISITSILNLSAQKNLISSEVSSFENKGKEWSYPNKDVIKTSTRRASSGKKSIKFFLNREIKNKNKFTVICNKPFSEKLRPGTYQISAKVWLPQIHPKSFFINLGEKGKPWIRTKLDLEKVKSMEWQTVKATLVIKKKTEPRLFLSIMNIKNSRENYGSFYIDDLELIKL